MYINWRISRIVLRQLVAKLIGDKSVIKIVAMARLKDRNETILVHIYTYILRFVGFQVVRVKYRPLVEFININPFMEIRFVFEFSKCRVRSRQKRRKIGK